MGTAQRAQGRLGAVGSGAGAAGRAGRGPREEGRIRAACVGARWVGSAPKLLGALQGQGLLHDQHWAQGLGTCAGAEASVSAQRRSTRNAGQRCATPATQMRIKAAEDP